MEGLLVKELDLAVQERWERCLNAQSSPCPDRSCWVSRHTEGKWLKRRIIRSRPTRTDLCGSHRHQRAGFSRNTHTHTGWV